MEIRFKNITITEKHIFNFLSVAMILSFIGLLYLKLVAKVEVSFTSLILAISGLAIWYYLYKADKKREG